MTLTKTMFLFGALSVALILPFSLVEMEENSIPFAEATPQNERDTQNTPNENTNKKTRNMEPPESSRLSVQIGFDLNPPQINENALNDLKIAVTKNSQVKELLGDDFEYIALHQLGNDDGWKPVLSYRTDNGENRVTVTMDKGKVVDVLKEKPIKLGGPIRDDYQLTHFGFGSNSYTTDEYNDDRYSAIGMGMYVKAPDYYTHNAGSFTALLVNAVKSGSNVDNLCDPTKFPTDYWGQIGFLFNAEGSTLAYTDTTLGCEATTFPILEYNAGDNMVLAIYIDDATDKWFIYADNLDDSSSPVAWVTIVPGSSLLDIDTPNTSVFFENNNHWWYGDWASGFTSDPVVDAAIWKYPNNYWYPWFNENQFAGHCEAETLASELMHGTFVGSPFDVTFDVSEIQEKCPAPDF